MLNPDTARLPTMVWFTLLALVEFTASYELGNDDTFRSQTLPKSEHSHLLLLPDPEQSAPYDATVNELKVYSEVAGVSIRLVLLQPDGDGTYDGDKYYVIGDISAMLTTPADPGPADWKETLASRLLAVNRGDRIAFAIYTQNPMPFEPKQICDTINMYLVHTFSDETVNMNKGDRLLFNRNTEDRCLTFSYTVGITATELPSTSTVGTRQGEVTGSVQLEERDTGLGLGDSGGQNYQAPCRLSSSECDQQMTVNNGENNGDSDLFRYIIFGPLVVLWIIVSILCTLKIKRRCCAKNGPVVTPVGQAMPGTLRPNPGDPQNPTNRRPRFARITLSRAPPQMMMVAQPKPLPQLTPSAALPPYPGLATTGSEPTGPNTFPPSYPPPAYSASKDTKYDSLQSGAGQEEYEFGPDPNAIYSSVHYVDTPIQAAQDEIPEINAETVDETVSSRNQPQQVTTWTSSYGVATTCPYSDPPPPYQQAPDAGHM